MLRASTAVALIFLLARACSLCAQESTCTKRIIPVGILDLHGVVPLDLGVNTFTAEFDRKPLEITAATLFTGPKRLAILMDTSGSMKNGVYSNGKAKLAYWVVADAVKRLPANVSIAVLGFNDQVDRKLDFSVSRGTAIIGTNGTRKIPRLVSTRQDSSEGRYRIRSRSNFKCGSR